MRGAPAQFVFGYGSLARELVHRPTREFDRRGFVADLPGHTRAWGVAMDNSRDIPGYKYYVAADGTRPRVFVAFLDVAPGAGSVNGVCVPVDDERLARLDARERNYVRVEVSSSVAGAPGARIWAYAGSAEGRARLAQARALRAAVIDAGYLARVRAAFRSLGKAEYERCAPSLEPGELPVRDLERRELPPTAECEKTHPI